jgi:hypothetical protein
MTKKGTVLLKSEQDSFVGIVDEMVQDFINSGHLNKENRELIKRTLLSNHRRNNTFSMGGMSRKKSTISEFFPIGSRRQSTFTADPTAFNSENASMGTSRKNSSVQFSESSNMEKNKNQKLSMSEFNLQNKVRMNFNVFLAETNEVIFFLTIKKYNSQFQKNQQQGSHTRENSVKFFVANSNVASENSSTGDTANTQLTYNVQKRRRSTIALLKNTIAQTKLNKVPFCQHKTNKVAKANKKF